MTRFTSSVAVVLLLTIAAAPPAVLGQGRPKELKTTRTIEAHKKGAALGVAFSKDGKFVVTCGMDKAVRVWEVATGKLVKEFTGHTDWIDDVALSDDGSVVASVSKLDTSLRAWDCKTGKVLYIAKVFPATRLALSSDGKTLVMGSILGTEVLLVDLAKGGEPKRLKRSKSNVWRVAAASSAPLIAFAAKGDAVVVWDLKANKELAAVPAKGKDDALGVALSADGKTLLWSEGGMMYGWDIAGKKEIFSGYGTGERITISPNGKYYSTESDAVIFSARTGKVVATTPQGPRGAAVASVAFSPDGKTLAVACNSGQLRLVDVGSLP